VTSTVVIIFLVLRLWTLLKLHAGKRMSISSHSFRFTLWFLTDFSLSSNWQPEYSGHLVLWITG